MEDMTADEFADYVAPAKVVGRSTTRPIITVDGQTLEEWLLWAHARIRIAGQDHESVLEILFEKWMPKIEKDGQTITVV